MKGEIIQEVLVVVKGMGSRAEGRKITRKKGRKEGRQPPSCSSFWPVNSVACAHSSS